MRYTVSHQGLCVAQAVGNAVPPQLCSSTFNPALQASPCPAPAIIAATQVQSQLLSSSSKLAHAVLSAHKIRVCTHMPKCILNPFCPRSSAAAQQVAKPQRWPPTHLPSTSSVKNHTCGSCSLLCYHNRLTLNFVAARSPKWLSACPTGTLRPRQIHTRLPQGNAAAAIHVPSTGNVSKLLPALKQLRPAQPTQSLLVRSRLLPATAVAAAHVPSTSGVRKPPEPDSCAGSSTARCSTPAPASPALSTLYGASPRSSFSAASCAQQSSSGWANTVWLFFSNPINCCRFAQAD